MGWGKLKTGTPSNKSFPKKATAFAQALFLLASVWPSDMHYGCLAVRILDFCSCRITCMKVASFSILSFALGWIAPLAHPQTTTLTLVGGTLIDVTNYGHSARDTPNAVVVLRGDKIEAAGPRTKVKIPKGARVIECTGKFILPGLVDEFAGLNSHAQANATLYMGVTTIVGSSDSGQGVLKLDTHPSPHVCVSDSAGSTDHWSLLRKLPEWQDKLKEGTEPREIDPTFTEA